MSRKTDPTCRLCDPSKRPANAYVLAENNIFSACIFNRDDGTVDYGLIFPKEHHADMTTLPDSWGLAFGTLYKAIREQIHNGPHNGYWNIEDVAGQTVLGHWHVRIQPRFEGEPSSNMGPGLLITTYNEVMRSPWNWLKQKRKLKQRQR